MVNKIKILIGTILIGLIATYSYAAISATAVWEVSSSGSATNGGFYVDGGGGVDRSQTNTPFDSGTDLAAADGDADPGVVTI